MWPGRSYGEQQRRFCRMQEHRRRELGTEFPGRHDFYRWWRLPGQPAVESPPREGGAAAAAAQTPAVEPWQRRHIEQMTNIQLLEGEQRYQDTQLLVRQSQLRREHEQLWGGGRRSRSRSPPTRMQPQPQPQPYQFAPPRPVVATRCVKRHPGVEFVMQDGAFSVRAKTDMPTGTLVFVEHVFSGSMPEMQSLMVLDDDLRLALYPRDVGDLGDGARFDPQRNAKKVSMNSLEFGRELVMGRMICKFNHACTPNSYLILVDRVGDHNFYGVWTIADVQAGDELVLDYTNGTVGMHDFYRDKFGFAASCAFSCTKEVVDGAHERAQSQHEMADRFTLRARETFILPMIDAYLERWGTPMTVAHKAVRRFRSPGTTPIL